MLSNVSVSWSRFKGVKGCACRVPGGQRLRLQVHRGWSGRPTSIEQYWKLLTTFERLNTIEDFWTLFKAIEQNRTLVSIIGLGYTELYMVVLGCTRRCWVVLGYTRLYWTVLGCTGPYWAVLGCAGLYYTILGGIFFLSNYISGSELLPWRLDLPGNSSVGKTETSTILTMCSQFYERRCDDVFQYES